MPLQNLGILQQKSRSLSCQSVYIQSEPTKDHGRLWLQSKLLDRLRLDINKHKMSGLFKLHTMYVCMYVCIWTSTIQAFAFNKRSVQWSFTGFVWLFSWNLFHFFSGVTSSFYFLRDYMQNIRWKSSLDFKNRGGQVCVLLNTPYSSLNLVW